MRSRNLPSLPSESRAILPGDTHPSSAEEPSTSGRSELADTEDEAGVEFETKRAGRGLAETLLYDGLETRPDVVKVEEADENSLVDGIRMYGKKTWSLRPRLVWLRLWGTRLHHAALNRSRSPTMRYDQLMLWIT
jgi:hypothetical protein